MSHQQFWRKVKDFFASLRLTIFLLITLSVTSIFGTVIPQGDIPHEYLHNINPNKLKLYQSLDLFDMYHSWWFVSILVLFVFNLIVCSMRRLPKAWRYLSNPAKVLDFSDMSGLNHHVVIPLDGAEVRHQSLMELLGKKLGRITVTEAGDALHLFAEKHSVSRLAVYVTHLSIVIILIGSMIGSFYGYKGYVNIPEGGIVSTVKTRSGETVDLGFSLRCDEFSMSHYPNGAPKEYRSILTVVGKKGEAVQGYTRLPVIVNDPLTYKGITFYQSSYGTIADHSFTVTSQDGKAVEEIVVPSHGVARLPDGSAIRVTESTPDVSQYIPGRHGPAAQVDIMPSSGKPITTVIFANYPNDNVTYSGAPILSYNGTISERAYTGLQVTKDPGVWVVWIGCILMILGIYGAFLMSHRRVWIRITATEITVAGHASKNPSAFAQTFLDLADAVRATVSKEISS